MTSSWRVRFGNRLLALVVVLLAGCAAQSQVAPATTTLPSASATTLPASTLPTATLAPTAVPTAMPAPTSPPLPTAAPPTTAPPPTAMPPSPTAQAGALEGQALVNALRQGGFVIFFRHAATDHSQEDTDLSKCETQRNLSQQGRADAHSIGQAFQKLNIPIDAVLSSGYCRTRDTAELAFGRSQVVRDISGLPDSQREQRTVALRKLLATPPQAGANTAIISHGFNIEAAANLSLAEGEAAIFRPGGEQGFALVARVLPEQWAALAQAYSAP